MAADSGADVNRAYVGVPATLFIPYQRARMAAKLDNLGRREGALLTSNLHHRSPQLEPCAAIAASARGQPLSHVPLVPLRRSSPLKLPEHIQGAPRDGVRLVSYPHRRGAPPLLPVTRRPDAARCCRRHRCHYRLGPMRRVGEGSVAVCRVSHRLQLSPHVPPQPIHLMLSAEDARPTSSTSRGFPLRFGDGSPDISTRFAWRCRSPACSPVLEDSSGDAPPPADTDRNLPAWQAVDIYFTTDAPVNVASLCPQVFHDTYWVRGEDGMLCPT